MTQHIDIFEINCEKKISSDNFLHHVLSNYLQVSAETLIIARSEFGKPFLKNFPQCHFNLSHSGEKMVLAISQTPVGIDIEQIKARASFDGIVKKCFAMSEQNYWFNLPENEKLTVFYNFWTRKEAVVKGIGRGIALGLNRCEINVKQPSQFLNLPVNEKWHTHSIDIAMNYCVSVATLYCDDAIKTHWTKINLADV